MSPDRTRPSGMDRFSECERARSVLLQHEQCTCKTKTSTRIGHCKCHAARRAPCTRTTHIKFRATVPQEPWSLRQLPPLLPPRSIQPHE
jgi:hypothetical protein